MIYRVLMDGQDIFNPQEYPYNLLKPQLSIELNTAGSFEFTMHPSHAFYDAVRVLTSIIEVYESEMLLWFGRPVEINTDFYNQKKVYCEGALAFFNDSVQRVHEYDSISLHEFFRTVIANHNAQVDTSKQFSVGTIGIDDRTVYRKLNYNSTFDCLKKQCLDAEGGYFFFRREAGVNYIDWLKEMPYSTNQPVEYGLNMLNASSEFDMTNFCTCVLPLGEETDGVRLTVESVNDGSDIIESEAVAEYGRIVKCVEFPGVTQAETLLEDGVEYLENVQFDNMVFECTAAELHWQNEEYTLFRLGQKIHAHSVPHLIDRYFDLLKMDISLETAEKRIVLGTTRKPTLTEITRENSSASDDRESGYEGVKIEMEDIENIIDDLTKKPDTEDVKWDIRQNIDDIRGLFDDDDFIDHIQDLINEGDLDDATPQEVIDRLGNDLDDFVDRLDLVDDYDGISGINDDLGDYWNNNGDIYNYDKTNYDNVSGNISNTSNTISGATDNSSMTEVKARLKKIEGDIVELRGRVDSLRDYIELSESWQQSVNSKLANLEGLVNAMVANEWVHQINGFAQNKGIVNFVTN